MKFRVDGLVSVYTLPSIMSTMSRRELKLIKNRKRNCYHAILDTSHGLSEADRLLDKACKELERLSDKNPMFSYQLGEHITALQNMQFEWFEIRRGVDALLGRTDSKRGERDESEG